MTTNIIFMITSTSDHKVTIFLFKRPLEILKITLGSFKYPGVKHITSLSDYS